MRRPQPRLTLAFAALALLVAGPPLLAVPGAAAKPARTATRLHPESGLRVIPLTVRGHLFAVELAATPAQQEKGLMFRRKMGANEGMLFPMNPPRQAYFWMRNTLIPLDIIYIGPDRRILNVVQARPLDETPLPSAGKAAAVLELNAGRAAELGIGAGDVVSW